MRPAHMTMTNVTVDKLTPKAFTVDCVIKSATHHILRPHTSQHVTLHAILTAGNV